MKSFLIIFISALLLINIGAYAQPIQEEYCDGFWAIIWLVYWEDTGYWAFLWGHLDGIYAKTWVDWFYFDKHVSTSDVFLFREHGKGFQIDVPNNVTHAEIWASVTCLGKEQTYGPALAFII